MAAPYFQSPLMEPEEDGLTSSMAPLSLSPSLPSSSPVFSSATAAPAATTSRHHPNRASIDRTDSPKNVMLHESRGSPADGRSGTAGGRTLARPASPPREAYIIGVAGGSASGKTNVASRILDLLSNVPSVCIVSQDSFYRVLTPAQSKMAFRNAWNFDHPDSFDGELFRQCLADLKEGKPVEIPCYDFAIHNRTDEVRSLHGASVVIVEGLFVLNDPQLRDLLDLKIYVQADADLMLARRITRDVKERGRDVNGIIEHYLRWVKPALDNHIQPASRFADIIVPGLQNEVAVDLVTQHVKRQLEARALKRRASSVETSRTRADRQALRGEQQQHQQQPHSPSSQIKQ